MTTKATDIRLPPRPPAKTLVHSERLAPNFAALWCAMKRTACLIGCLFCYLGVMMFYGAMVEGLASWSGSLAMCGVCIWMCRALYRIAEGEERHSRRMQRKAQRKRRLRQLLKRIFKQ